MNIGFCFILIYAITVIIISVFLTVSDKSCAKKSKNRIRESTLLMWGLLGGAGAMFLTMKIIRHKTKKMKFMLTLPLFFVLHLMMAVAIYCLYSNVFEF